MVSILLPRLSSRMLSSGCYPEHYARNQALPPAYTGALRESKNSDSTAPSDDLITVVDFADWTLFPEGPKNSQGLPQMETTLSSVSGRWGPCNVTSPPTPAQITSASFVSSSKRSCTRQNRKITNRKTRKVVTSWRVQVGEIKNVEASVAGGREMISLPRPPKAPIPQRLPTPDMSDVEQDDFWTCCIDPNATEGGEGHLVLGTEFELLKFSTLSESRPLNSNGIRKADQTNR